MRRDTFGSWREGFETRSSLGEEGEDSESDEGKRKGLSLEARSVIRQVGIHIYRVVKSIGVSVSRVSCKEGKENGGEG